MPALLPMRKDAAAPALQIKNRTPTKKTFHSGGSRERRQKTNCETSTYKNTVSGPTVSAHQVVHTPQFATVRQQTATYVMSAMLPQCGFPVCKRKPIICSKFFLPLVSFLVLGKRSNRTCLYAASITYCSTKINHSCNRSPVVVCVVHHRHH